MANIVMTTGGKAKGNPTGKAKGNPAGKVWVNRFDNYKRAQAFARENDAKVERTGDSVMKYRVVTVGVHN